MWLVTTQVESSLCLKQIEQKEMGQKQWIIDGEKMEERRSVMEQKMNTLSMYLKLGSNEVLFHTQMSMDED